MISKMSRRVFLGGTQVAMGLAVDKNKAPVIPDKARSDADPGPREAESGPVLSEAPDQVRGDRVGGLGDSRGEIKKPDEVAIFDYIYGVLHCPAYRETYAEFLKIDFPRIPYPDGPGMFWDISAKGAALRKLHLMDPAAIGPAPFPFEGEGDPVVVKPVFEPSSVIPDKARSDAEPGPRETGEDRALLGEAPDQVRGDRQGVRGDTHGDRGCTQGDRDDTVIDVGTVAISKTHYFSNVPRTAWEFYIGGYQPAQKWLKDRKGRALEFADIQHYQNIIKILMETDRIMKTITLDV